MNFFKCRNNFNQSIETTEIMEMREFADKGITIAILVMIHMNKKLEKMIMKRRELENIKRLKLSFLR